MEKTGNLTVNADALDTILIRMANYEKTALEFKKKGCMDDYYINLGMYIAQKSTLEQLGLIVPEDYDFSKEA